MDHLQGDFQSYKYLHSWAYAYFFISDADTKVKRKFWLAALTSVALVTKGVAGFYNASGLCTVT